MNFSQKCIVLNFDLEPPLLCRGKFGRRAWMEIIVFEFIFETGNSSQNLEHSGQSLENALRSDSLIASLRTSFQHAARDSKRASSTIYGKPCTAAASDSSEEVNGFPEPLLPPSGPVPHPLLLPSSSYSPCSQRPQNEPSLASGALSPTSRCKRNKLRRERNMERARERERERERENGVN